MQISRRVRITLAVIGGLLLLSSIFLLGSLKTNPPRDQLRYDPPATLFAPPEMTP